MNHQIVIVGGGAGGLELATKLGKLLHKKQHATVTLVDSSLTHIWKPLLHEVAAGSLNPGVDEVNYITHAQWNGFTFQHGCMTGLDRDQKQITLKDPLSGVIRNISYNTLVIAVGSQSNDFGTPGVQEHCLFLDSRIQAERLHQELLFRHMRSHASDASRELSVAIVGAGATGVELSAELHHAMKLIHDYGVKNAEPDMLKVTLIEAAPRILPVLPERLSKTATIGLQALGVDVRTGTAVESVNAQGMVLKDGSVIKADFKVWAAGIRAPVFLRELGLEVNRINQLVVRETLQTTVDDSIFAFGDCASCPLNGDRARFVPPRAQAANQQAKHLARSLIKHLAGQQPPPFVYKDKGTLVSLASFDAVGILGAQRFTQGKVARLLYSSLYRLHQAALFGVRKTALKISSDILQRKIRPRLRLH